MQRALQSSKGPVSKTMSEIPSIEIAKSPQRQALELAVANTGFHFQATAAGKVPPLTWEF